MLVDGGGGEEADVDDRACRQVKEVVRPAALVTMKPF